MRRLQFDYEWLHPSGRMHFELKTLISIEKIKMCRCTHVPTSLRWNIVVGEKKTFTFSTVLIRCLEDDRLEGQTAKGPSNACRSNRQYNNTLTPQLGQVPVALSQRASCLTISRNSNFDSMRARVK